MTRRWAPQTRYTLRRNKASKMKDLVLIDMQSADYYFAKVLKYAKSVVFSKVKTRSNADSSNPITQRQHFS